MTTSNIEVASNIISLPYSKHIIFLSLPYSKHIIFL